MGWGGVNAVGGFELEDADGKGDGVGVGFAAGGEFLFGGAVGDG